MTSAGVSFVVPVHNGRRLLPRTLDAIRDQQDGRPFEIIAIDDASTDASRRYLARLQQKGVVRLIDAEGRGAAAAINLGIGAAAHPFICQVDQDVVLERGWLTCLMQAFDDAEVAAAQGQYITHTEAGFWARISGRDLEQRYSRLRGGPVDHACTGNTVYRASALHAVGLLDERLGYGYDNDLSYRLTGAGFKLVFCPQARSVHHWREGIRGYLRQQLGVAYGRLDVVARHPHKTAGDQVSNAMMMAHAPAVLVLIACAIATAVLLAGDGDARVPGAIAVVVLAVLLLERGAAGVMAWRRTQDRAALAFPIAHLVRDLAWVTAIVLWCTHRLRRRAPSPTHSMRRGSRSSGDVPRRTTPEAAAVRMIAIVPAHNEAGSLPRVVDELRRRRPEMEILVVDDGSADETAALLATLGVRWLSMPERVGVGGAVRAGLRYALAHGFTWAVRVDGDGQHRARDITRLYQAAARRGLDVAIGSRFLGRRATPWTPVRAAQAALGVCLTVMTGRRVTDPTCGFAVFGPRAMRLLARHHPTGYAEPELLLLLSRNGLAFGEVPIRVRPRLAGTTTLTPSRAAIALARTLLALVIVPARSLLADGDADR